jgi:hypothetical protein
MRNWSNWLGYRAAWPALVFAFGCGGAITPKGERMGDSPVPDGANPESGFATVSETMRDGGVADRSLLPRIPKRHRAFSSTCTDQPPLAPDPQFAGGFYSGNCRVNADCTNGLNGRCSVSRTWAMGAQLYCTYDECVTDKDCKGVCQCGRDALPYNHVCAGGNCRLDSDCGDQYCSPSRPYSCVNYERSNGYYCHTTSDECVDDSDCLFGGHCSYDPVVSHWACSSLVCTDT